MNVGVFQVRVAGLTAVTGLCLALTQSHVMGGLPPIQIFNQWILYSCMLVMLSLASGLLLALTQDFFTGVHWGILVRPMDCLYFVNAVVLFTLVSVNIAFFAMAQGFLL